MQIRSQNTFMASGPQFGLHYPASHWAKMIENRMAQGQNVDAQRVYRVWFEPKPGEPLREDYAKLHRDLLAKYPSLATPIKGEAKSPAQTVQFGALTEDDKELQRNLLQKLVTLSGGTKAIRKLIPDWDRLPRLSVKIWRLLGLRGDGKPTKGWDKQD